MTIVDSADSVLMLYSYAGFADQNKWALFKNKVHVSPTIGMLPQEHDEEKSTCPDPAASNGKGEPLPSPPNSAQEPELLNCLQSLTEVDVSLGCLDNNIPTSQPLDNTSAADTVDRSDLNSSALERTTRVKLHTMSNLSIVLTLVSILVAFRCDTLVSSPRAMSQFLGGSISLITIMSLIGEQCGPCQKAAMATDGGLAGSWWRGWAKVRRFCPLMS